MFKFQNVQIFKCSNFSMFQYVFPLVHWSIGPLIPWSIGPLVHYWSIGPLVHWSIGWMSNVKFHMTNVKNQMSNVNKIKLLSERTSGVGSDLEQLLWQCGIEWKLKVALLWVSRSASSRKNLLSELTVSWLYHWMIIVRSNFTFLLLTGQGGGRLFLQSSVLHSHKVLHKYFGSTSCLIIKPP